MASIQPLIGVLGFQNAKHLLSRATFNPNKSMINLFAGYTVTQAIDALFAPLVLDTPEPLHFVTGQPYVPTYTLPNPPAFTETGEEYFDYRVWWIRNAQMSQTIHHKLSLFLHTIYVSNLLYYEELDNITLLLYYSTRSIKELAKKVTRSNGMLAYLTGELNTKFTPNENYAREFLELFTILKGPQDGEGSYTNYTEYDVQMAAKVFTGLKSNFNRVGNFDSVCKVPLGSAVIGFHDTSNKTFSAKFNNQTIIGGTTGPEMDAEIDSFIDMVFAQPETARAYSRRLYRYFVKAEINSEIESDIITPIANNLLSNNYDITSAVRLLLSSSHFYDEDDLISGDEVIGALVKNPVELILIMLNQFRVNIPNPSINHRFYRNFYLEILGIVTVSGMHVWNPSSVVGYAPYYQTPYNRLWISPSHLKNRYDVCISTLLKGFSFEGITVQLNTAQFVRDSGYFTNPSNAHLLVDEILDYLFVEKPSDARLVFFQQALLGGLSVINWQNEWNRYINTGIESAVRTATNRLITSIVKSKEYQVF